MLAEAGADLSLRDALAAAAGGEPALAELTGKLREENARLREDNARLLARAAERDAELDRVRADLAVLQRMLFGRSSERSPVRARLAVLRPAVLRPGGDGDRGNGQGASGGRGRGRAGGITRTCPGSRCSGTSPAVGTAARSAGAVSRCWAITCPGSLDWQVIVRVVAHCRRRYRRGCACRVPATVMAPGPPKAIGKGLLSNGFIAHAVHRAVCGRAEPELPGDRPGPARRGDLAGDADRHLRGWRGRCWPRWRGDHRPVAGFLAPAR